jgi:riboflavin synthase
MANRGEGAILEIETSMPLDDVKTGDSISVSGACLTVTVASGRVFTVDVSAETLFVTTLPSLKPGMQVNLEKALRATDRLGGHIVLGHVDGTGKIIEKTSRSGSFLFGFAISPDLYRYVVVKGSITVDGISLTVNHCENGRFYVNVIPHTAAATTLGMKKTGDDVNIETDIIGRYIEKLLTTGGKGDDPGGPDKSEKKGISLEMLSRYGFMK